MNASCSTPETICLQCGDIGFTNAFVHCVKCQEFAVHRYCLGVTPNSADGYVRWVCDDYDVEVQNQPAVCKSDAFRCKARDHTASKHILGNSGVGIKQNVVVALTVEEPVYDGGLCQSIDSCSELDMVECDESVRDCDSVGLKGIDDELVILSTKNERKICENSSFQQLEEEKIKDNLICKSLLKKITKTKGSVIMVSTLRKDQHRHGNNSSKRPHEKYGNSGVSDCAKFAGDSMLSRAVKENTSEKRNHRLSQQLGESNFEPNTVLHRTLSRDSSVESSTKKKDNIFFEANLLGRRDRCLFTQHLKEQRSPDLKSPCSGGRGINASNDHNKKREVEISEDQSSASQHMSNFCDEFLKDSTISLMIDCNMHAAPLNKPIWRGSFDIWNKNNILEGLMAHISSRACRKAYDEACQFQPLLRLEMLPKFDVWPKSFETLEPSGENIALYFFPSELRNERVFDQLVDEMVHEELALRTRVLNAELLVFTSMELSLPYWRIKGKYYLWGVFREKRRPGLQTQSSQWKTSYDPTMREDLLNNTGSSGGSIACDDGEFSWSESSQQLQ